jgi:BirA family biotin operon repressor/biotin-[acetyl-CoA-carboxylase] ligase
MILPEPSLRLMRADPPLFFLKEVESTNTFLRDWGNTDALQSGTSLYAERQTRGRGRPGNVWIHAPGNLALSMWIRDDAPQGALPWTLSMAYCLMEELAAYGLACSLKFPNDLWRSDTAGKIGGILVERSKAGWTIGAGLNRTVPDVPKAAGWDLLPDIHTLAASVTERFFWNFLSRDSGLVTSGMILDRLNENLLWKGRWVAWNRGGRPEMGKIESLGPSGRLKVLLPSGRMAEIPEAVRSLEPVERARES